MQLEKEFKSMENNKAIFSFMKEDKKFELNLDSPNFSEFVKNIILNNYEVTDENIKVELEKNDDNKIDIDELKSIVIEIHKEYFDEIGKFYENIKKEIKTYYSDDEELIKYIQEYIEKSEINKVEEVENLSDLD